MTTKDAGEGATLQWPNKYDLFGVLVSATTYDEASELIIHAARNRNSTLVDHMPVHGLIEASRDPELQKKVNSFEIIAPDGQPVRWALNRIYATQLNDRVYGPELMLKLCRRAAEEGIGIYLYGSHEYVVQHLRIKLVEQFPKLQVVGYESPPFRPLTSEEDQRMVNRINESGAGLVFLGLGCPKQEVFAYDHRNRIHAVQLCVGAAFDFLSGNKKMSPKWMQSIGLEWLFRLLTEPKRLWRRYLFNNTKFIYAIILHALAKHHYRSG